MLNNKNKVIVKIICMLMLAIYLSACGNNPNEASVIEKLTAAMETQPYDYYADNEIRCRVIYFDSCKDPVILLAFGHGFDLYSMDVNGNVQYTNRFSESNVIGYDRRGYIYSYYSSPERDITCITAISDQGLKLLETYERRVVQGVCSYYKDITNVDPYYIGEHCLSEAEGGYIVTADTFYMNGTEISEKTYNDDMPDNIYFVEYNNMLPYSGKYVLTDW